ncbi:MAG: Crp/Fnr family transcriptional regulator [Vicinamibacterales bacterium]
MEWAGRPALDAEAFFDSVGVTRRVATYAPEAAVFSQGDASDRVLYIQEGEVELSVRSQAGREALIATLGPGHFFGEACLAGERIRIGRATATRPSRILVIDKREMARRLREEPALSDWFIAHILTRNISIEEDLVDQLFNSCERRLACVLLLLARYGLQEPPERVVPMIPASKLADMVGTTAVRIDALLRKFRALGFISYGDAPGLTIDKSLLGVVLDDPQPGPSPADAGHAVQQ